MYQYVPTIVYPNQSRLLRGENYGYTAHQHPDFRFAGIVNDIVLLQDALCPRGTSDGKIEHRRNQITATVRVSYHTSVIRSSIDRTKPRQQLALLEVAGSLSEVLLLILTVLYTVVYNTGSCSTRGLYGTWSYEYSRLQDGWK